MAVHHYDCGPESIDQNEIGSEVCGVVSLSDSSWRSEAVAIEDPGRSPAEVVEVKWLRERVRRAVATLAPSQRRAIEYIWLREEPCNLWQLSMLLKMKGNRGWARGALAFAEQKLAKRWKILLSNEELQESRCWDLPKGGL
jgi:hypothetical protein